MSEHSQPENPITESDVEANEGEDWGFSSEKRRVPKEAKIGIGAVLILLVAFAFVLYPKIVPSEDSSASEKNPSQAPDVPDQTEETSVVAAPVSPAAEPRELADPFAQPAPKPASQSVQNNASPPERSLPSLPLDLPQTEPEPVAQARPASSHANEFVALLEAKSANGAGGAEASPTPSAGPAANGNGSDGPSGRPDEKRLPPQLSLPRTQESPQNVPPLVNESSAKPPEFLELPGSPVRSVPSSPRTEDAGTAGLLLLPDENTLALTGARTDGAPKPKKRAVPADDQRADDEPAENPSWLLPEQKQVPKSEKPSKAKSPGKSEKTKPKKEKENVPDFEAADSDPFGLAELGPAPMATGENNSSDLPNAVERSGDGSEIKAKPPEKKQAKRSTSQGKKHPKATNAQKATEGLPDERLDGFMPVERYQADSRTTVEKPEPLSQPMPMTPSLQAATPVETGLGLMPDESVLKSATPPPTPMPSPETERLSTISPIPDAMTRPGTDSVQTVPAEYYVVQENDNFWSVSKKVYGTARYFQALALYNKRAIPDPRRMRPGTKLVTPSRDVLESSFPKLFPRTGTATDRGSDASAVGQKHDKKGPNGYFLGQDGMPLYRVGTDDTLTGIAQNHLGRSSRWIQIYQMNRDRLENPDNLEIGTILRLPSDASRIRLVETPHEAR